MIDFISLIDLHKCAYCTKIYQDIAIKSHCIVVLKSRLEGSQEKGVTCTVYATSIQCFH